MKGNKPLTSLLLMFAFGSLVTSCQQQTSSKSNSGSSGNSVTTTSTTGWTTGTSTTTGSTTGTSTGNCAYGTGNESGISDSGQTIEYYKINSPAVVAHGANYGTIVFNSATDLPASYNQNIFFTDSRFNLRVIPKYQRGGTDSKGRSCDYYSPRPFTKMNIGVVVRSRQSSPGVGDYYTFTDVDVNCPSKVREFQVPSTPDPLVVEIMNVEWDYSCIDYAEQGFDDVSGVCPYDRVWLTECYQLEVQFATDTTKNIPGTRAY
jgi:hypothetical protein